MNKLMILWIALLVGCGDQPASTAARVFDESPVPRIDYESLPEGLPLWSVEAALRIGASNGTGADVFGSITSVALRSNGGMVVADGLNLDLKAFSASGDYEWTAGRKGPGPGEFQSLVFVGVTRGDSVVAFGDRGIGQLFDPAGRFVRQITLARPEDISRFPGIPRAVGVTSDGYLVMTESLELTEAESEVGYFRTSSRILVYDLDGSVVRQLPDVIPVHERLRLPPPPGESRNRIRTINPAVRKQGQFAVGGTGFVVNVQDAFELRRYSSTGSASYVVSVGKGPIPFDDRLQRRYREARVAAIGRSDFPASLREAARLDAQQEWLPDRLPAVGRVLMDSDEQMWVESFSLHLEELEAGRRPDPPLWEIFSSTGEPIAKIVLPLPRYSQSQKLHAIGSDQLIVSDNDPQGLFPYVEVYRIIRDKN